MSGCILPTCILLDALVEPLACGAAVAAVLTAGPIQSMPALSLPLIADATRQT
jgi:hypothetical protein